MTNDAEHLRLLSTFHYVVGGLTALCACIPFFHLALGVALVFGEITPSRNGPPPRFYGWLFIIASTAFISLGWIYSACMVAAGRLIRLRRGYTFCLVMAGLSCLNMPHGTCLGVFTIIVLVRPSVKALFDEAKPAPPGWDHTC